MWLLKVTNSMSHQELALFGDFTMMETMYYFGILNRMSCRKIKERGKFLTNLLELPTASKSIKKLRSVPLL